MLKGALPPGSISYVLQTSHVDEIKYKFKMDEPNQQIGSDTVLKDYDLHCDTSLKGTADEVAKQSPGGNSSDVSNNDAIVEALNTNGIDKESEAQASDNNIESDLECSQFQETNTLSENLLNELGTELSASSADLENNIKKYNDGRTENEITLDAESTEKNDFNEKESIISDMSVCQGNEEKNVCTAVKIMNILENQLTEDDKGCDKSDLSKNNVFNENFTTTENNRDDNFDKKYNEVCINVESEIINPSEGKCSENELSDSFKEPNLKKDSFSPTKDSANKTELVCSPKQVLEVVDEVIDKTNTAVFFESNKSLCESDKKNIEIFNNMIETVSETISVINEKIEEGNEKESNSEPVSESYSNADAEKEEKSYYAGQSNEELQDKLNSSNSPASSEIKDKEAEINKEISISNLEVNLCSEVLDSQEKKKSEEAGSNGNNQEHLETVSVECEKENLNLESKNDSVQEHNNSQGIASRLNSSGEQEESLNKSENDGNEIMDTEMVNCNEIEQIDLSENETDLKGESRDEEMMADSLETTTERSSEDQMTDEREDSRETDKNEMLIDEEVANQPGNSEEETITGDTTSQPSTELAKEKNEELCIIPDDVIPVLSILPQNKEGIIVREEDEGLKVVKVSTPELLKPKTRAQDKRNLAVDSKPRPIRNAAKLAGNKIKSLVESDLVFDESGDLEEENDFHENTDESAQMCAQCREVKVCKLLSVQNDFTQYLCSEQCSAAFKATQMDAEPAEIGSTLREYAKKCSQCLSQITVDENRLFWETMDFCNEDCLGKYQLELGSNCANCKKSVPSTSLGKYCVRFGYDIKQFCSALCLEEYKKGLKVCSYCQKDISTGAEGFLAPVGNKGQFKDFCSQSCMEKYDRMSSNKPLPEVIEECAVCSNSKPVQVEVELENKTHKLCSEPCFAAFKFVNNILEGQCDMCRKYFDRAKIPNYSLRLLFYDETLHSFCSKTCMNVYILANRKIVPCNWCKVKKYNFDMIKKVSPEGQLSMMCSLNCLMLYQTSVNAVCSRPIKCDYCKKKFVRQPLYHLTMSDATLRNFCSYNCVMSFQNGYPKQKLDVGSGTDQLNSPVPTGGPKRILPKRQVEPTCVPVISSVQSLASPNGPISPPGRVQISRDVNLVSQVSQPLSVPSSPVPAPPPQIYQQIILKPTPAKQMKNKSVLCKPYSHTKGVSCRPHPCLKETQTDQSLNRKFLIPIPVPIYVPAPMHMFATPFPVPVPFPLPIPVPIFIPTTRNSAKGIMKEIKKIQEKIPNDPFEAELLMMAEMVAGDKKQDPTDSESEDGNDGDDNGDGTFSPENVDTSNTFGDDMLQMALKMASELEEPAVDMESVLTSNTITTTSQPAMDPNKTLYASDTDDPDQVNVMAMSRNRKRSVRGSRNSSGGTPSKRGRRTSGSVDVPLLPPPEPVPPRTIEVEKPDANMCLKYTFGVNAWRHWVMQKNAELEKAALTNRKIKLFKPELLQLTADELNFSLCLFVKEVRKPNGTEYAPDTIYYLCLGIQQYLFENGRIDNIFTDSYYEKFTDCLDEVAKKFAALYNDSQYIVTRVEEEHLWESKQLGAHSPHVLLSTLMFFNTKHFNLVTVEEHMQLSFSHIMKHWKRNPNTPGIAKIPGSRNVLLRFYPPQSALEANSRKKKVYEQQENEENPLRCPVKLYEFYLSKCPESVKTRNDVFYLLPERSCVPDSPVWYSTMALGKEPLMKMLHRIKMVKEINIALLTS